MLFVVSHSIVLFGFWSSSIISVLLLLVSGGPMKLGSEKDYENQEPKYNIAVRSIQIICAIINLCIIFPITEYLKMNGNIWKTVDKNCLSLINGVGNLKLEGWNLNSLKK